MAKNKTKPTPDEPRDPRPPEPPTPAPACPFEDERDRQALERVRRFLIDREPLTGVYGDKWYVAAQVDLFRVAVFVAFRNHAKTQNYLLAFMDGLAAARFPSLGLAPPRVKLDPKVAAKRKG